MVTTVQCVRQSAHRRHEALCSAEVCVCVCVCAACRDLVICRKHKGRVYGHLCNEGTPRKLKIGHFVWLQYAYKISGFTAVCAASAACVGW